MDPDLLQLKAYADAKAALLACAKATRQIQAAVVELEAAREALRRANAQLAEANRIDVLRLIMAAAHRTDDADDCRPD